LYHGLQPETKPGNTSRGSKSLQRPRATAVFGFKPVFMPSVSLINHLHDGYDMKLMAPERLTFMSLLQET